MTREETFDHTVTTQEFPTLHVARGQNGRIARDADGNATTLAERVLVAGI